MNKLISSLVLAFALCISATAQTSTNLPSPASWPSTVLDWVSGSDTNITLFNDASVTLWAGNSYLNNSQNASTFGADVRVWKSESGLQLTIESETKNAGVAGTLYSQQAGFQFGKGIHDLRFGGYINGGYSFFENKPFIEAGGDFRKAIGKVSFIGLRVGYQFIDKQPAGAFSAFLGVKL